MKTILTSTLVAAGAALAAPTDAAAQHHGHHGGGHHGGGHHGGYAHGGHGGHYGGIGHGGFYGSFGIGYGGHHHGGYYGPAMGLAVMASSLTNLVAVSRGSRLAFLVSSTHFTGIPSCIEAATAQT